MKHPLEHHKHRFPRQKVYTECGPGWNEILDYLLTGLSEGVQVLQIKEKFGTLRCYLSGGTDADYMLVRIAEEESARTCDACGARGRLRGKGWFATLCDNCART